MAVNYNKNTWRNDSAPYLNETNLNNIEDGIEDCANEINAHEANSTAHHNNANDPTTDQKAALSGTSGIPSNSNKYVTDSDARMSDARTPLSHTHTESEITDIDHDAEKIMGVNIDSTVGSPSDGDILVFRDAGSDFVLEQKPAGGSNPALNGITDVNISSVADNELLSFESNTGEWINKTAAEAGFSGVATSGSYNDLSDKPFIPSALGDLSGNLDDVPDSLTYVRFTPAERTKLGHISATQTVDLDAMESKVDTVETNADVTDAANVDAAGAVMNSDVSTAAMGFIVDEDDMISDSAIKVPTQQSVKAYVDANSGSSPALNDVTDVVITGVADNDLLAYDQATGDWKNQSISDAGINMDNVPAGSTYGKMTAAQITDAVWMTYERPLSGTVINDEQALLVSSAVYNYAFPLSGGVLTGDIDVNGNNIEMGSDGRINFGGSNTSISEDFSNDLQIRGHSTIKLRTSNALRFDITNTYADAFVPIDMNGHGLGDIGTATFKEEYDNGNSTSAATINWNNSQKQAITLNADCTISLTNLTVGVGNLLLRIVQDTNGSRVITWPSGIKWVGGTEPTLSTAGETEDIITMYWNGTDYYAMAGIGFA